MFTGLIADRGTVLDVRRDADGATLRIATALAFELGEGDSIAVNGVCLTATGVFTKNDPAARAREGAPTRLPEGAEGAPAFETQAMHETLRRSTLDGLAVGEPVNLELALRADGRLGGHIVQGHVDGVATAVEIRDEGFSRILAFDVADSELLSYVVEKGSIALSGVSLTVSALRDHGLEVSLIPETLQRTTLGDLAVGDRVNVEVDVLSKHVQRLLGAHLAG